MEELKKSYLEEIESLLEEFKENKELPEINDWNDTRSTRINEVTEPKEYTNDLEGELLQKIDETRDPYARKDLIEELKQIREARKEEIQQEIYDKTKEFQSNAIEKLEKELDNKQTRLKELRETKAKFKKEHQKYLGVKKTFNKENEIYRLANNESKELLTKMISINKEEVQIKDEIVKIDAEIGSISNLFTEKILNEADDNTKEAFKKIMDELEETRIKKEEAERKVAEEETKKKEAEEKAEKEAAIKEAEEAKEKKIEENKLRAARVLSEKYGIIKGDILYDKIMEIIDININVNDISEVARTELTTRINNNINGRYDKDIEKLQKEMDIAGIKYDDIISEAEARKVVEAEAEARKVVEAEAEAKRKAIEEAEAKRKAAEEAKKKEIEAYKLGAEQALADLGIKKGDILYDRAMKAIECGEKVKDMNELARKTFTAMIKNNTNGEHSKEIEKLQKEMDTVGIKYDDIIAEAEAKRKAAEEAKKKAAEEAKKKAAEEAKRKAAEEKARREAEEKRKAELKKARQATPVKLIYSAKTDAYLLKDDVTNTTIVKSRKELETIDKKELQEKLGKDLTNVDIDHLQMLSMLDKDLAKEYVDSLSEIGKNKEERIAQMKELGISVDYKLKGIYDKNKYTERERDDILENANNAKAKGVATVEKGIKVNLLETANKIKNKAKTLFSNIQLLGKGNDDIIEQDKLEKKMAKKEARKNTFEKAVNNVKQFGEEIRANVNEEEAAIEAERKADVKKVMAEEKEEQK